MSKDVSKQQGARQKGQTAEMLLLSSKVNDHSLKKFSLMPL
jgi:hypothetical protein